MLDSVFSWQPTFTVRMPLFVRLGEELPVTLNPAAAIIVPPASIVVWSIVKLLVFVTVWPLRMVMVFAANVGVNVAGIHPLRPSAEDSHVDVLFQFPVAADL